MTSPNTAALPAWRSRQGLALPSLSSAVMLSAVIVMPPSLPRLVSTLLALVGLQLHAQSEWPRFRGPNGSGLGGAHPLPARWNLEDALWNVPLPGPGHSSPVLYDRRIYLNCAASDGQDALTVAIDADTGRLLWQRRFPGGGFQTHRNNSYASSTPAVDDDHVYVTHQHAEQLTLYALDHNGREIWRFPVGPAQSQHGLAHSPIVFKERVILALDTINPGRIVALDAANGRLLWEIPRSPGRADYSTPCVIRNRTGRVRLIFNSQEDGMTAVDPLTGHVAWQSGSVLDKRSVSSPLQAAGLLISSCGSGGGGNYVVALRPPETPGGEPEIVWTIRRSAPYVPTPIAVGGRLFFWSDGGVVTCVEPASGREIWRRRVGGDYFSSPVYADGKLFNLSTTGRLVALAAEDAFRVLGETDLSEGGHATPAIALGRLYCRTFTRLVCLPSR